MAQKSNGSMIQLVAQADDENERLDAWLAKRNAAHSRNQFKALIKQGSVRLQASASQPEPGITLSPNYRIKPGDVVVFEEPEPLEPDPKPENIPLNIVYEDNDLIVLNKPAGLVVHPAAGHWTGTLVNALLYHCGDQLSGIGGVKRPGIVHRLDKNTTGLMVVAKNELTHKGLAEQFADHGKSGDLVRAYKALVWGQLQPLKGTINLPLSRSSQNRLKRAVVNQGGQHAVTHYTTLEQFGEGAHQVSHIECRLETGRTHQIRVHLAHKGHPLLGDADYGTGFATKLNLLSAPLQARVKKLGRQALHAYLLGFKHPKNGKYLQFESDFPKDLRALTKALNAL